MEIGWHFHLYKTNIQCTFANSGGATVQHDWPSTAEQLEEKHFHTVNVLGVNVTSMKHIWSTSTIRVYYFAGTLHPYINSHHFHDRRYSILRSLQCSKPKMGGAILRSPSCWVSRSFWNQFHVWICGRYHRRAMIGKWVQHLPQRPPTCLKASYTTLLSCSNAHNFMAILLEIRPIWTK